ncbi:hypothetical protein [Streptomyces zhihengii]
MKHGIGSTPVRPTHLSQPASAVTDSDPDMDEALRRVRAGRLAVA